MPKKFRRVLAVLFAVLWIGGAVTLCWLRPDWGYRAVGRLRDLTVLPPLAGFTPAETVEYVPEREADTLLLINADHPLPSEFVPDVVEVGGCGMYPALAEAYAALSDAVAEACGARLLIRDAYRSREVQVETYAADPTLAALPGTSEHEAALALDLCVAGYGGMAFLKTAAGRFVGDEAHRFGLIVRYPDGGEGETGIPYEPWHFRYVGQPHASVIAAGRMTLEGYLEALMPGEFYRWRDWCIIRQPLGETYRIPAGARAVTVAPDNTGHAVVSCLLD